jgi:membrane associated rhomboid family serine protease
MDERPKYALFPPPAPSTAALGAHVNWQGVWLFLIGVVVVLSLAHLLNELLGHPFDVLGLQPRSAIGLSGVVFMPLIHANWLHLSANLFGLLPLLFVLRIQYANSWGRILVATWLGSGWLLWSFGRPVTHIGASALVYGLIGYFLLAGIVRRDRQSMATAFLTLFLNQGFALGFAPVAEHISWDGHLSGFVAGIVAAVYFRKADLSKDPLALKLEYEEKHPDMGDWDYQQQLPENLR